MRFERSTRVYRRLLRALPAHFRERYGDELVEIFRGHLEAAVGADGHRVRVGPCLGGPHGPTASGSVPQETPSYASGPVADAASRLRLVGRYEMP